MNLLPRLRSLACATLAAAALPAFAMPDLVILVRHAERAAEPAGDPGLTPAGERRAQALAQALAGAKVNAILTTQFRRTRETAAPLAKAQGLQPQVVEARRGESGGHIQAVADAVRAQTGTVLVVGHSNTVPAILAALGGPQLPEICETSFGHVFLLRPGAGWMQFDYGEAGAAPAAGCL